MTYSTTLLETAVAAPPTPRYHYALGYLRAFTVALVVAHHAVLAYHPFAPPVPASLAAQPRLWQAFPIVDAHRSALWSLLVGFNDVFFMSLLFFLSGLFVWQGLQRKGSAPFLRGRLLRLGLPFAVAIVLLAPLAYYPTYLQIGHPRGVAAFCNEWIALGQWPTGPAWFIWVLLAFDCAAALLFATRRNWGNTLGRVLPDEPGTFFALLVGVSAIAYVPMALLFTPFAWSAFGPFTFQTSRIVHYLVYFVLGVAVGAAGLERGLLGPGGKLARRWLLWSVAAVAAFAVASAVVIAGLTLHGTSQSWALASDIGFVVSCAASCFAFLAVFVRFAQSKGRVLDSLAANAYAIYLVHYVFVTGLQYALLPVNAPGFLKGVMAFAGAFGLSWASATLLRRIPAVARVL